MTQCPLVSISCLTYNHAPYLRQCLDGFVMQITSFPIEILIYDDASGDGTQNIIEEYHALPFVLSDASLTDKEI